VRRRSVTDRRSHHVGWRRARRSAVLLGLLLAALMAGTPPAAHSHDGPGLYDQQCLLSCLAAGKPSVPSSSVSAQATHVPAPDATPSVVAVDPADVTVAAFDSRGPPR